MNVTQVLLFVLFFFFFYPDGNHYRANQTQDIQYTWEILEYSDRKMLHVTCCMLYGFSCHSSNRPFEK